MSYKSRALLPIDKVVVVTISMASGIDATKRTMVYDKESITSLVFKKR